ncbi:unnamed protein product [Ceratitis capitata]|uniref:(Mediterranean fruit fly) hypothetical protein n=1 Tax=Ceratitis capitata TaxID=7213 RepID=A0A811VJR1_CERCA|nr:unnamed protein product [Ceratitis capitata]
MRVCSLICFLSGVVDDVCACGGDGLLDCPVIPVKPPRAAKRLNLKRNINNQQLLPPPTLLVTTAHVQGRY